MKPLLKRKNRYARAVFRPTDPISTFMIAARPAIPAAGTRPTARNPLPHADSTYAGPVIGCLPA